MISVFFFERRVRGGGSRLPKISDLTDVTVCNVEALVTAGTWNSRLFQKANAILVHESEDGAQSILKEARKNAPDGCILVEYSDDFKELSYKSERVGKKTLTIVTCTHRAIEKNGRQLIKEFQSRKVWNFSLLGNPEPDLSELIHNLAKFVAPLRLEVELLEGAVAGLGHLPDPEATFARIVGELEGGHGSRLTASGLLERKRMAGRCVVDLLEDGVVVASVGKLLEDAKERLSPGDLPGGWQPSAMTAESLKMTWGRRITEVRTLFDSLGRVPDLRAANQKVIAHAVSDLQAVLEWFDSLDAFLRILREHFETGGHGEATGAAGE